MSWYRSGRCRASCLCLLPTIFEITLVLLPVLFSSKPSLQLLVLLVVVDLGQELGFRTFVQVETCYLVEEFSRREYVRNTPPVKKLKPRIRIFTIYSQVIHLQTNFGEIERIYRLSTWQFLNGFTILPKSQSKAQLWGARPGALPSTWEGGATPRRMKRKIGKYLYHKSQE